MFLKRFKMRGLLPILFALSTLLCSAALGVPKKLAEKIYTDFTDFHEMDFFSVGRVFYSVKVYKWNCSFNSLTNFTFPPINSTKASRSEKTDLMLSVPIQFSQCVELLLDLVSQSPHVNIRIALNAQAKDCDIDLLPYLNGTSQLLSGSHTGINVGIEFNEHQPHCKRVSLIKDLVDFFVIKVDLGAFVESYGLFHRRMKEIQNLLEKETNHSIFYHLILNEASAEEADMLGQFAQAWIHEQRNGTSVQIIVPNPGNITVRDKPSDRKEIVIPSILETEREIKWYSGKALEALKEKFRTVFLTYAQWNQLALSNISSSEASTLPDIILDFSHSNPLNWTEVQDMFLNPTKAHIKTHVKRLAFPLPMGETETETTVEKISAQIALHTQFQIGYSFILNSDLKWETYLQPLEKIGGNFFIIFLNLTMSATTNGSSTYNDFVNVIVSQLNKAKRIRDHIHNVTPTADVYLRVVIQNSVNKNYQVTVFCNDEVLQVNEFYEAILNWGERNDFPLILKSAFDTFDTPDISSWMSVLRPYSSVTAFIANPQHSQKSKVPFFVMRNYPPNINGWETHPCVEWWGEKRHLNFTPTFFKNEQLGAIVNFGIRKNHPIYTEEVQALFQFVFHRFSVAVLLLTNAEETVNGFEAVSEDYIAMLAATRENSRKVKLYLDYKIDRKEVKQDHISKVYHRFDLLTRNAVVSLEGMHFQYSEVLEAEKEGRQHIFHLLTSSQIMRNQVPVGIRFTRLCLDELLSPLELHKVLKNVHYVVCPEAPIYVESEIEGVSKSTLGTLFDTHLYIKNMFGSIKPGLEVIFEVELAVNLDAIDSDKMQRYLRLLHHFREFGAAYGIQYFVVEAFDKMEKSGKTSNGWWTFSNFSNLSDMNVYVEKMSELQGKATWKPQTRFVGNVSVTEPPTPNPQPFMILTYSGIAVGLLLVLFALVFGIRFVRTKYGINDASLEMVEAVDPSSITHSHVPKYELALPDINIDYQNILGSGAYGIVYAGLVKGHRAAIKCPSQTQGCETFNNVLTEIKVLCHLGSHPNLVQFLGAYVAEIEKGKLFLATQLCPNGSLQSFLRKNKAFPTVADNSEQTNDVLEIFPELCRFSLEIALGMEYIVIKNVVHGDLAARNVLLDSDCVCKIGDFGLSRKLYEYEKYMKLSQEPLPWKWMAYESLVQMEFTSMSDMWSYGITVWEIFSLGNIPYAGLNWTPKFPDELRNGLRLPAAQFATGEIHEKLLECWNLSAGQRPTFSDMVNFFKNLRSKAYVELTPLTDD